MLLLINMQALLRWHHDIVIRDIKLCDWFIFFDCTVLAELERVLLFYLMSWSKEVRKEGEGRCLILLITALC
jgi:hypothetical protein